MHAHPKFCERCQTDNMASHMYNAFCLHHPLRCCKSRCKPGCIAHALAPQEAQLVGSHMVCVLCRLQDWSWRVAWITRLCSLYCLCNMSDKALFWDQALLHAIFGWQCLAEPTNACNTPTHWHVWASDTTQCSVTQARVPTPAREAQEATSSRPSSQEIASQIEGFEDDFKVTNPLLRTK